MDRDSLRHKRRANRDFPEQTIRVAVVAAGRAVLELPQIRQRSPFAHGKRILGRQALLEFEHPGGAASNACQGLANHARCRWRRAYWRAQRNRRHGPRLAARPRRPRGSISSDWPPRPRRCSTAVMRWRQERGSPTVDTAAALAGLRSRRRRFSGHCPATARGIVGQHSRTHDPHGTRGIRHRERLGTTGGSEIGESAMAQGRNRVWPSPGCPRSGLCRPLSMRARLHAPQD